ncbi:LRAT domain-containing protein [Cephalotus follicularis]|uniref:LRAT domain-containing protein n=1 Tax=Cephalotus follicularis TaxID=3775 RepID=A0A1Q3D9L6_CEPFO|nr:LRAT domain-containing protein [Cephalotus follicularis]
MADQETHDPSEIDISKFEPGNHIFTYAGPIMLFTHHGIYAGDGKVIHFVPRKKEKSKDSVTSDVVFSESDPGEGCDDFQGGTHGIRTPGYVVKSDISSFGDKVLLYKYGVSETEVRKRPGTCCPYECKPLKEVLKTAEEKLKTGFGIYNDYTNNSEHFATFCSTGKKYSGEALYGHCAPESPGASS